MPDSLQEIRAVAATAERIASRAEVEAAVDRMAGAISARLGEANPVLLGVMVGGIIPLGMLLARLEFPLQVDYVHATRYEGNTAGGKLRWQHAPPAWIRDRMVLVVDDVFDVGHTLATIVEACRAQGAREVLSAVIVRKQLARAAGFYAPDFVALDTDDRYLFGYGMDYKNYLRNAPGIYAVTDVPAGGRSR